MGRKEHLCLLVAVAIGSACESAVMDPPTEQMLPPVVMDPPKEVEPPPPPPWMPPEMVGQMPIADLSDDPDVVEVQMTAAPVMVTLFDGLELELYAYNGALPGPVIQAKVGDRVVVHFTNQLPEPTTIHWHGLRIPDDMDGSPRIQAPVLPGESFTYDFVVHDAGAYWYHPHVRAHEQVEKGLYGTLVVHELEEPEMDAERYVVLDDILVSDTGLYPFLNSHPELMHGRSGNVLLTNGTAEEVVGQAQQGEVERWRIVNTANARTMELTVANATIRVIGTDGGRIDNPEVARRLILPVGARYELEVRYENAGRVELQSHVLVRNDQGEVVKQPFTVFAVDVAETGVAPRDVVWPAAPSFPRRAPDFDVEVVFDARQGGEHGILWTLNGQAHREDPLFVFRKGDAVRMRLINNAGPEHPFHLHGQFFEVPAAWPGGLRDTVLLPGLETVEIIAYFDNPGQWMAHCHILEHAELGMMAEIVVEE